MDAVFDSSMKTTRYLGTGARNISSRSTQAYDFQEETKRQAFSSPKLLLRGEELLSSFDSLLYTAQGEVQRKQGWKDTASGHLSFSWNS